MPVWLRRRLHWLTNNAAEWTGLKEDNAIVEPINRRGPPKLPLKEGAWNQVSVQLADGRMLYAGKELWSGERRNGVTIPTTPTTGRAW